MPTYVIYDFPQQASSFENDPWQPVVLAGDVKATRDVKFLYSGNRQTWFSAVGSWRNDRGNNPGQVAGELAVWWLEVLSREES